MRYFPKSEAFGKVPGSEAEAELLCATSRKAKRSGRYPGAK